jgi:hypothetical protein
MEQSKSMRSIIDATQLEQRQGSTWNWCVGRDGVPAAPHSQHNPTPSPHCAFGWHEVPDGHDRRCV